MIYTLCIVVGIFCFLFFGEGGGGSVCVCVICFLLFGLLVVFFIFHILKIVFSFVSVWTRLFLSFPKQNITDPYEHDTDSHHQTCSFSEAVCLRCRVPGFSSRLSHTSDVRNWYAGTSSARQQT